MTSALASRLPCLQETPRLASPDVGRLAAESDGVLRAALEVDMPWTLLLKLAIAVVELALCVLEIINHLPQ